MKFKFTFVAAIAMALVCGMGLMSSCGDDSSKKPADGVKKEAAKDAKNDMSGLPNYRYVDLDTLLSKYHLAKDYNEEMLRMQTNMENEVKNHESRIQNMAVSMNKKMQNNGYLSEASVKQDQEKLASMQNNAQKRVSALQSDFEKAAMNAQKAVNDSIEAFIKTYNENKGYDAIFFKAATLYIDPRLDITDEVLNGLNERYNKIKK